jgi:hypothetical protein
MSTRSMQFAALSLGITFAIVIACGCTQSPDATDTAANTTTVNVVPVASSGGVSNAKTEEHPHIPGNNGGIIINAEAVVEKDGQFRLLMLGADESRIQEVDIQAVKAYVRMIRLTVVGGFQNCSVAIDLFCLSQAQIEVRSLVKM